MSADRGEIFANRYLVIEPLGEGGFGTAYLVQDTHLKRKCVAKMSKRHEQAHREQFEKEAQFLAGLSHPNLPQVYDYFIDGGYPFLVMQFIQGATLNRQADGHSGPFEVNDVLRWASDLIDALVYLHSQQPPIIHRDIKPSNVCITLEGKAVLLDFGIARELDSSCTGSAAAAQSMYYSPIEQYRTAEGSFPRLNAYLDTLASAGVHTGPYSDVYSLGATLYYALSLRPPLDACMRIISGEELKGLAEINCDVPEFLAHAIDHALAIDPRQRCQTAAELKRLLQPPTSKPGAFRREPTFFSRPRLCRNLTDRSSESAQLLQYLEDESITAICLTGPSGVGKTELAAWLCQVAQTRSWRVRWVDCTERDVTDEAFLAAVAGEAASPLEAAVIRDRELRALDRLDAALDVLESQPTLIVMDGFQNVGDRSGIPGLLTHVVHRSSGVKLKFVLASRESPPILDHPSWPPGVARSLAVAGLPRESILQFLASDFPRLTEEQHEFIWERTSGHPYALGLLKSLVRRHGWEGVHALPLYSADQDGWFSSLLGVLEEKQNRLAQRLCVVRTGLTDELIGALWDDATQARRLAAELRERSVLQAARDTGALTMYEFLRVFLYERVADEATRTEAHRTAARVFLDMARGATGSRAQADYFGETIYHLDRAAQRAELLKWAGKAFDLLNLVGDWSRAGAVANCALRAARDSLDRAQTILWLARLGGWELDHEQREAAEGHLNEALSQPLYDAEISPEQWALIQGVEARVHLEKGRLAYYTKSNVLAIACFEEALSLARHAVDRRLMAECLVWIGRVERNLGRFDVSGERFREASTLAVALGDVSLSIQITCHLGLLTRQQGDLEMAKLLFTQARGQALAIGDRMEIERNSSLLADLHMRQGNHAVALPMLEECLRISREINKGVAIRINAGQLAECLVHLGQFQRAAALLDEVERRSVAAEDGITQAWTWKRRGELLKFEGRVEEGNRLIEQGLEKLREMGSEVYIGDFKKALEQSVCDARRPELS